MRLLGSIGTLVRVKRLLAICLCALAFPAAALAWGGSYPTGDAYGSAVTIDVSDAYPVDEALPQDWASYLGTLVHGPELARLTLDLMPLSDVQGQCGEQALACYDPRSETIYASPEDQLDSPPAKEIVAHEYGHHVAANRADAGSRETPAPGTGLRALGRAAARFRARGRCRGHRREGCRPRDRGASRSVRPHAP